MSDRPQSKRENKVAIALATMAAMREYRKDKPVAFQWPHSEGWAAVRNGDRVKIKSTGDTAVFIAYRELPDSWVGSDRVRWLAFVEYPNGDRDMRPPNDLEPLERKP